MAEYTEPSERSWVKNNARLIAWGVIVGFIGLCLSPFLPAGISDDDPYRFTHDSITFVDIDTKQPIPDVMVLSFWRGREGERLVWLSFLSVGPSSSRSYENLSGPVLSQSNARGVAYIDSVKAHAFRTRDLEYRGRHVWAYKNGYESTLELASYAWTVPHTSPTF